jgi:hypothetical protein
VDANLDTLATALYVRTDDLLKEFPERATWRPAIGITPELSDAELLTLAVMQALLGFVSESRWLRYARRSLRGLFPCLPGQSGYNKRLRKLAATMAWLIRALARDTSLWADDVWVVDSTPVECGRLMGGLVACAGNLRFPSGIRHRARRRWRGDARRGAATARTCVAADGAEGAARR